MPLFDSKIIMRVIFEDEYDGKLFLKVCRVISKIIEENEELKS